VARRRGAPQLFRKSLKAQKKKPQVHIDKMFQRIKKARNMPRGRRVNTRWTSNYSRGRESNHPHHQRLLQAGSAWSFF